MPIRLPSLRYDVNDRVTPDDLNVAPALLGLPLARPGRRLLAISVDVLVVVLVSDLGNLWLLTGLVLLALLCLHSLAWAERSRARKGLIVALAVALLAIGVQRAWATGEWFAHTRAVKDSDELPAVIPGLSPEQATHARIALLQAQVLEAREKRFDLKAWLTDWVDEVGLGLGWAIAYFSLLPAWWNGQTLGKRLFGLRVVELTGKPLTVMRAFKRYGGYAAGLATGLFGFAQVFWDSNRQAIQDKTAHTVVIDLRRAAGAQRTTAP